MNAPRKINSANWRNIAAEVSDARELRQWATRVGGRDVAGAALAWMGQHRDELPQLKTGIHPHKQRDMIEAGAGVDGIACHYDAALTTRLSDEYPATDYRGELPGCGNRWVSHLRPYDANDDTGT